MRAAMGAIMVGGTTVKMLPKDVDRDALLGTLGTCKALRPFLYVGGRAIGTRGALFALLRSTVSLDKQSR